MDNLGWLSEVIQDMIYFTNLNGMDSTAFALEETMEAIEHDIASKQATGLGLEGSDETALLENKHLYGSFL